MDKTMAIAGPISNPGPTAELCIEFFKKLNCHVVQWDDNNLNAIANARGGHIFMMAICDTYTISGGVATYTNNNPMIKFTSRIRFQDN